MRLHVALGLPVVVGPLALWVLAPNLPPETFVAILTIGFILLAEMLRGHVARGLHVRVMGLAAAGFVACLGVAVVRMMAILTP